MSSEEIQGFRLSPLQRRLWRLQSEDRPLRSWCVVRLRGRVDAGRIRQALTTVVGRHGALRTTFHRTPGVRLPIQVVADEPAVGWTTDTSTLTGEEDPAVLFGQDWAAPFDLAGGSVLRARLVERSDEERLLLLTLPSLCCDSASLGNLVRDLLGVLASDDGAGGADEEEPVQYVQLSEWLLELLADPDSAEGLEFWRRESPELRGLPLPLARLEASGGSMRSVSLPWLDQVRGCLETTAQDLSVSLDDLLLAAWQVLLWRLTGRRDATVGRLHDGRKYEELADGIGLFARWLPADTRCRNDLPFAAVVEQVAGAGAQAEEWLEYLDDDEAAQADGLPPRFTAGFELETAATSLREGDLEATILRQQAEIEPCVVSLSLRRQDGRLAGDLRHDADRYAVEQAEQLAGHFHQLVSAVLEDPRQAIGRIELLPAAQRQHLVTGVNASTAQAPDQTLVELFEERVRRDPGAVAARFLERVVTYGELNATANAIARRLRRAGVGPEARVGLYLGRSPELLGAILGVLKAGGAYLPLDVGQPRERQALLLADASPAIVISRTGLADHLPEGDHPVLLLDAERDQLRREEGGDLPHPSGLDHLAYVLYTSGSTGRPKGVMVTHRGLANYLAWAASHYGGEGSCDSLVHSPIGFDLTVTTLFVPLLRGGSVRLLPEEQGVEALADALRSGEGYDLVKVTPSHLQLLNRWLSSEELATAARCLVIGGEALFAETLAPWRRHAPATRLVNEYGPTETVVGCGFYDVVEGAPDEGAVPCGRPVEGARMYVLDRHLEPVPLGVTGELYVGGAGVARGYAGRPDLTAASFLPDPFSSEEGDRLYRTGDLARRLADGDVEFLGRADNQVKVRGFRVELGEVEAALDTHPAIAGSAVTLREDAPGDQRLVAYLVAAKDAVPAVSELRQFLSEKVPEYMVPSTVVRLNSLPLTANGKVDRSALPEPSAHRPEQGAEYVAPRSEIEREVAELWAELLRVERVGIDDDFFDLGGHSLLATQAIAKLRASLGVEVTLEGFFAAPSVRHLASLLEEGIVTASDSAKLEEMLDLLEGLDDQEAEKRMAELSGHGAPVDVRAGDD